VLSVPEMVVSVLETFVSVAETLVSVPETLVSVLEKFVSFTRLPLRNLRFDYSFASSTWVIGRKLNERVLKSFQFLTG